MLKQLRLKKQIELLRNQMVTHETRLGEIATREEELAVALEEAATDEDLSLVDEEIKPLTTEKEDLEVKKTALTQKIADLEAELGELNKTPEAPAVPTEDTRSNNKEEENRMSKRVRGMKMNREQRLAYLNHTEVRSFYENIKKAIETRSIAGLDLTIPQVVMDTIQDDLGRYSVLYNLVKVVKLTGEGRAIIAGEAPEAVWMEMIGKLNELEGLFTEVEVDGYKVGGFIPLHNSLIEDSMINLSAYVDDLLAESIAIALDKAVLYGTGTKMPLGIIPALHADYVADPVSGLRTTNIITLSVANTKFANIIQSLKYIKRGRRGRGPITILMSESTWLGTILPMSLANNASGSLVTAANQAFPGIGYKVEFCEDIPEDTMVAGDFSKYLLAERSGVKGASSSEFMFTSDKTVFKATARYDGKPVKKAAFVLIGLNNVTPAVTANFAADEANA